MLCKKKHQSSSKAWPRYSNFLYDFVINGSLLSAFRGNISVRLIVSIGISQIVPDFFYICLRGMIVIFLIWNLFAINAFSSLRIYKTSMKWQNSQWVGKFKILNRSFIKTLMTNLTYITFKNNFFEFFINISVVSFFFLTTTLTDRPFCFWKCQFF